MDLDLSPEQEDLLNSARRLLSRHAGPARARQLDGAHDADLFAELSAAGMLELPVTDGAGLLEAVLVVEAVSQAVGATTIGASALVAPGLGLASSGPIALVDLVRPGPVRWAPVAEQLLVVGADTAWIVPASEAIVTPVPSHYGVPFGSVVVDPTSEPVASGAEARALWRLAVSAEIVGLADGAMACAIDHVRSREQFGKPIATFQAVQHQLAEVAVLVEGTRWLTRSAAATGAELEAAAVAATAASLAASVGIRSLHQVTGALGLTLEFDLQLWTMRMHAARTDLGGISRHRRAVAAARWAAPVGAP